MKMLEIKDLCVCEITAILGLAQSTVSKHLKILEDANLVDPLRDGAWVNYKLIKKFDNQYAAVMQEQLQHWFKKTSQIQEVLKQVDTIDRHQLIQIKKK